MVKCGKRKDGGSDKVHSWGCTAPRCSCSLRRLSEDDLRQATASILGIKDYEPAFVERVRQAVVFSDSINYEFKDSGMNLFSAKVRCGDCGGWYGSRVWHSNDKYRKVIYRCNQKYKGECKCSTPHLTEVQIKDFFVRAINQLIEEKEETLANLETLRALACGTDALEQEKESVQRRAAELEQALHDLIEENKRVALDQEEYDHRYAALYTEYEGLLARLDEIAREIDEKKVRGVRIQKFAERLMALDGEQSIFDEQLWGGIVEYMTVYVKGKATFTFAGGIEVTVG